MAAEKVAAGSLGTSTASRCFAPRAFLPILVAATLLTVVVIMIRMETIQVRHVRHKNPSPNQRKLRTFEKKSVANATTCKCQDAYLRSRLKEYQRLLKQVVEEHRLLQSKFNDTLLFLGRCLKRHECPPLAQQSSVEILQDESPTMIAVPPAKGAEKTKLAAPRPVKRKEAEEAEETEDAKKISVAIPGGKYVRKSDRSPKDGEQLKSNSLSLKVAEAPNDVKDGSKNESLHKSGDGGGLKNASLTQGGDSSSNVTEIHAEAKGKSANGTLRFKIAVEHASDTRTATGSETNAAEKNAAFREGTGKMKSELKYALVETQTGSDGAAAEKSDREALLADPESHVFADVKVNFGAFGNPKKLEKPASVPKTNRKNAISQNKIPGLNSKPKDSEAER